MHGCPASARYQKLGENALVLWHGTTARRAERIAQYGLFHKRGVWAALEPKIAHGFSRFRGRGYRAGSAAVVLLLGGREARSGVHYEEETAEVFRFHSALPAESVERVLSALGSAAAIEIFSTLYATIDPWEALRHQATFEALERLCRASRHRCGVELFSLEAE
jgi:hypothetical protein